MTPRICPNCEAPCFSFDVRYCVCGYRFPTIEEVRQDSRQSMYDNVLILVEAPGTVVAQMYDRFVKSCFGQAEFEKLVEENRKINGINGINDCNE